MAPDFRDEDPHWIEDDLRGWMMSTVSDQDILLNRLVRDFEEKKHRVVFLVGSGLNLPVRSGKPGVPGVEEMIRRVESFLDSGPISGATPAERYQRAFAKLLTIHNHDVANRIVREAVLDAWEDLAPRKVLKKDTDNSNPDLLDACEGLERDLAGWCLTPGAASLGQILATHPEHFGHVLTTNFDPLIEVSIHRANGHCLRTVFDTDGRLGNAVPEKGQCHVVYAHGYWYGKDTLHTSLQIERNRPGLDNSLANLLRGLRERDRTTPHVVVVAYGGWADVFTTTLLKLAEDSVCEILWTFFRQCDDEIVTAAGHKRISFFEGIDCNDFFPKLWNRLPPPPSSSSEPVKLPRIWNVPHHPNRRFFGRDNLLQYLHRSLHSGRQAALPQVMQGLGGVGKTQLVVEFLYRHMSDYDLVWWVRADDPSALRGNYLELAKQLNLPEKDAKDQRTQAEAIQRRLKREQRWILIFDNVMNPDDLSDYLLPGAPGHVLVTSRVNSRRRDNWWGIATPLTVHCFDQNDSIRFLHQYTKDPDKEAADKLAEALGNLPLALDRAASHCEESGLSLSECCIRLAKLQRGEAGSFLSDSLHTTWISSLKELQANSPAATQLLKLGAFMAPNDIPKELFLQGREVLPKPLRSAARNEEELDRILAVAGRLSLLDIEPGGSFSIHPMVQAAVREQFPKDRAKAVRLINCAYSADPEEIAGNLFLMRLHEHALAAIEFTKKPGDELEIYEEQPQISTLDLVELLTKTGLYLHKKGTFKRALNHFQLALRIENKRANSDPLNIARLWNNTGQTLQEMSDLKRAIDCTEHALQVAEKNLGENHPGVAIIINNQGTILEAHGDLDGALKLTKRAYRIAKLANDQLNIAIYASNVAFILQKKGDLDEALVFTRRALRTDDINRNSLRLATAISASNAGQIMQDLGEMDGALDSAQKALKLTREVWGDKHHQVAIHRNNIGQILHDNGDLASASRNTEESYNIAQDIHGNEHPVVATAASNLGRILKAQRDLDGALERAEEALRIDTAVYAPDRLSAGRVDVDDLLKQKPKHGMTSAVLGSLRLFIVHSQPTFKDRSIHQILSQRWDLEINESYCSPYSKSHKKRSPEHTVRVIQEYKMIWGLSSGFDPHFFETYKTAFDYLEADASSRTNTLQAIVGQHARHFKLILKADSALEETPRPSLAAHVREIQQVLKVNTKMKITQNSIREVLGLDQRMKQLSNELRFQAEDFVAAAPSANAGIRAAFNSIVAMADHLAEEMESWGASVFDNQLSTVHFELDDNGKIGIVEVNTEDVEAIFRYKDTFKAIPAAKMVGSAFYVSAVEYTENDSKSRAVVLAEISKSKKTDQEVQKGSVEFILKLNDRIFKNDRNKPVAARVSSIHDAAVREVHDQAATREQIEQVLESDEKLKILSGALRRQISKGIGVKGKEDPALRYAFQHFAKKFISFATGISLSSNLEASEQEKAPIEAILRQKTIDSGVAPGRQKRAGAQSDRPQRMTDTGNVPVTFDMPGQSTQKDLLESVSSEDEQRLAGEESNILRRPRLTSPSEKIELIPQTGDGTSGPLDGEGDTSDFGPKHPNIARDYNNLASILRDSAKTEDLYQALKLALQARLMGRDVFGGTHPYVAVFANNLGQIYQDLGQLGDALKYTQEALYILQQQKTYGRKHHIHLEIVSKNLRILEQMMSTPARRNE